MSDFDRLKFYRSLANYVSHLSDPEAYENFLIDNYASVLYHFYPKQAENIESIIQCNISYENREIIMKHILEIGNVDGDNGFKELMIYFRKSVEWRVDEFMASEWTVLVRDQLLLSGFSECDFYDFFAGRFDFMN